MPPKMERKISIKNLFVTRLKINKNPVSIVTKRHFLFLIKYRRGAECNFSHFYQKLHPMNTLAIFSILSFINLKSMLKHIVFLFYNPNYNGGGGASRAMRR